MDYPPYKSDYIGVINQRETFFVKLTETLYISRLNSWVYNFVNRNGDFGVFFSKNAPGELAIEVGDCFVVKMTPKKQDISSFHKGKETVFNRIEIIENVGKKI